MFGGRRLRITISAGSIALAMSLLSAAAAFAGGDAIPFPK
jgi:hypothetical protein